MNQFVRKVVARLGWLFDVDCQFYFDLSLLRNFADYNFLRNLQVSVQLIEHQTSVIRPHIKSIVLQLDYLLELLHFRPTWEAFRVLQTDNFERKLHFYYRLIAYARYRRVIRHQGSILILQRLFWDRTQGISGIQSIRWVLWSVQMRLAARIDAFIWSLDDQGFLVMDEELYY